MGHLYGGGLAKFYESQVGDLISLLERKVRQAHTLNIDKYLKLCEQLGKEPDPREMPLEDSDFPEDVQVAFFIYSLLKDKWEGMSGMYMGKDWSDVPLLLDIYDIEDRRTTVFIMKLYENIVMKDSAEREEKKQKREQNRKSSKRGSYTYNVKGR